MTPPTASIAAEEPLGLAPRTAPSLRDALIGPGVSWGERGAAAIRFIRFAVVGGLASAVYLSLTAVLLVGGLHYMAAATIGYLTAIATNFSVNRQWTFAPGVRRVRIQALSFLGVQLSVGAMNLSLLHILVIAGVSPVPLAQLVSAAVLLPLNFLASQRFGFR